MSFKEAISLLDNPRSSKRRQGAKTLRKLKNREAGPFLLKALEHEVKDQRTWETQYQMIMALGECEYYEALPFLKMLATMSYESTAIPVALGDTIIRLARRGNDDMGPVLDLLACRSLNVVEGAFRAMAMLRMRADDTAIEKIIDFLKQLDPSIVSNTPLRFWVAIAAAGWKSPLATSFLEQCASFPKEGLSKAAVAALSGRYFKCDIL